MNAKKTALSVDTDRNRYTIGIVGGGRGGTEILNLFHTIQSFEISYVTDINPTAPALLRAAELNIHHSSRIEQTICDNRVDFVIEATGLKDVYETVRRCSGEGTEVLSSNVALMMFDMFIDHRKKAAAEVIDEIGTVRQKIVEETRRVGEFIANINDITLGMKILSLNAAVEAARAGLHGAGFGVVAGEMKSMSERTRLLSDRINEINKSIGEMSASIDDSMKKLA